MLTTTLKFAGLILVLAFSSTGAADYNYPASESDVISRCETQFANNHKLAQECVRNARSCAKSPLTRNYDGDCVAREMETLYARQQQQQQQPQGDQSQAVGFSPPAGTLSAGGDLYGQCETISNNAKAYCSDPLAYSTENAVEIGSRENASIAANVMMFGTMLAGSTGKGNRAICSMMKTGGAGITGLNGIFAARCASFISDCEKTCGTAKKMYANDSGKKYEIESNISICKAQSSKAAELSGAAGQAMMAAFMGKTCQDAAEANDALKAQSVPTPAELAAVDGGCVAGSTDPLCAGMSYTGPGGAAVAYDPSSTLGGDPTSTGFNISSMDENAYKQLGSTGGAEAVGAKNAGVANGGGQMLGGGNNNAAMAGPDGGGRGGSAGYKTDVLQGERSGGGYSVVAQGFSSGSSGGWSGYGANNERAEASKPFGLDLKQFLPGMDKKAVRGPAGLNRSSADLGPMHEDIFKKISDRVTVVCRTNRLRDCR